MKKEYLVFTICLLFINCKKQDKFQPDSMNSSLVKGSDSEIEDDEDIKLRNKPSSLRCKICNENIHLFEVCNTDRLCVFVNTECSGKYKHFYSIKQCNICHKSREDPDKGKCPLKSLQKTTFSECPQCKSKFKDDGYYKPLAYECMYRRYVCLGKDVKHYFNEAICMHCKKPQNHYKASVSCEAQ